jgi:hypothetical protein
MCVVAVAASERWGFGFNRLHQPPHWICGEHRNEGELLLRSLSCRVRADKPPLWCIGQMLCVLQMLLQRSNKTVFPRSPQIDRGKQAAPHKYYECQATCNLRRHSEPSRAFPVRTVKSVALHTGLPCWFGAEAR